MPFKRFDLESKLRAIVAETGTVHGHVGGLEISVLDPELFPWYKIFMSLSDMAHEIWVRKEDRTVVIRTKPPSV